MIREVTIADAGQIRELYNHYVLHSTATFEEVPVTVAIMEGRIRDIRSGYPYLVCEDAGEIVGYAYATRWKERSAYRYSVESTVYVKNGRHGRGIGRELYGELLAALKRKNLHAVLGGITLPNEASIKLHEHFGFQKVGQLREVGYKFGRWLDVGYWQLILGSV